MKKWETKSGYKIIQVLSGRSNVFLLTNGSKNILIDTSSGFMWRLLRLRLNNLNVNHIDCLILTHSHMDHAGNAYRIRDEYKSLVFIHKNEASCLTSGNNIIPDGTVPVTQLMMKFLAKWVPLHIRFKPCQYDISVDSVFDLSNFGFKAYILHTPGHSTGSMSVIIDDEIALVGDTMFGVFPRSVFPPYASDVRQMINSWGKLLDTKCSVFIPSHGSADSRSLVQREYNNRI
jgi:hydroxyacylglutathione hydrolase